MSIIAPDPTLQFVGLYADQTEDVILARMVNWANEGLDPVADANQWTDTREGGHWSMGVIGAIREIARLYDFLGTEVPMSAFVLWAWGTYLDDLASIYQVQRLPATQAAGFLTFAGPAGTVIAEGTTAGTIPSSTDQTAPTFGTTGTLTIPGPQNLVPEPNTAHLSAGDAPVLWSKVHSGPLTVDATTAVVDGTDTFFNVTVPVASGGTSGIKIPIGLVRAGRTVTATVNLRAGIGGGQNLAIALQDDTSDNGGQVQDITITGSGTIGQVSVTWTPTADSPNATLYCYAVSPAAGNTFGVVNTIVDFQSSGPLSFEYGDTGGGWSWVGTAGQSASVSNTGVGSIDIAILATNAGAAGDVDAGAITAQSTPLPANVTFINNAATLGGTDTQSDENLRARVLQAVTGRGPGAIADYLNWASAWPGVGSVKVVPVWDGAGTVLVMIGDPNGQPLPSSVTDGLQDNLDPVPGKGAGTAPVGAEVTVETSTILDVVVAATVTYEDGYSVDGAGNTVAVGVDIAAAISAYLLTVQPGDDVILAHVSGLIATWPGVHDVTAATLNGTGANLAVGLTPPEAPQLTALTI